MPRQDGVDGAGLAGIRPAGESHLAALIGRKLLGSGYREQESHLWKKTHRGARALWTNASVQFAAFEGARKTMIESRFSMKFAALLLLTGFGLTGIVAAQDAAVPAPTPASAGSAEAGAAKAAVCTA